MNGTLNMHRCKSIEIGQKNELTAESGISFVVRKVTFTGNNGSVLEINIFGDPVIEWEKANGQSEELLPR